MNTMINYRMKEVDGYFEIWRYIGDNISGLMGYVPDMDRAMKLVRILTDNIKSANAGDLR